MCGIAGYVGSKLSKDTLHKLCDALAHRGPDGHGIFTEDNIGFVHTRLAIIDLTTAAAQPFQFNNWVLTFNGEIYNYQEIRKDLIQLGYHFQTQSDTEVIIKAFDCWQEKAVEKFIGMFAFAIYNTKSRICWIFRDRVGVKPLYYACKNETLYFSSELKAFQHFPIDQHIDPASVDYYFKFGFTPVNQSIFSAIKKLQPGTYLKWSDHQVVINKYWSLPLPNQHLKKEDEIVYELEALLISACRYRMVSDVPVGIFLSGGVDSSLVSALLTKHYGQVSAFNIGFKESSFDESGYANQIATYLNIPFHAKQLTLQDAKQMFNHFYSIYDEPFADTSGIPTACISSFVRDHGFKVVLSADGGDELFAGYNHYQRAIRLYKQFNNLPRSVRRGLSELSKKTIIKGLRKSILTGNFEHKVYAMEELLAATDFNTFYSSIIANQTEAELANLLSTSIPGIVHAPVTQDSLYEMRKWDLENYMADDLLVKVDRATMYNQVECREPLLDHRLVEFAFQLPATILVKGQQPKYLLKSILAKYIPRNYFERKKQGFSIPIFQWFKQDLDSMFDHYLTTQKLNDTGLFNVNEVRSEIKKYKSYKASGKDHNIEKMWRILSFMMWFEKYSKYA